MIALDDLSDVQKMLIRRDWRPALLHLQRLTDTDPFTCAKLLCCAYIQANNWHQVSNTAAVAAQHFPEEAIFYECWAWAEHYLGDTRGALRILNSVQSRFSDRESFVYLLACLHAARNEITEAERFLARAKNLTPDLHAFYLKAGSQRELQVLWKRDEIGFSA
jgi:hypothetical protein